MYSEWILDDNYCIVGNSRLHKYTYIHINVYRRNKIRNNGMSLYAGKQFFTSYTYSKNNQLFAMFMNYYEVLRVAGGELKCVLWKRKLFL